MNDTLQAVIIFSMTQPNRASNDIFGVPKKKHKTSLYPALTTLTTPKNLPRNFRELRQQLKIKAKPNEDHSTRTTPLYGR